ncbi:hypothetical protein [Amycolatopsis rifamycinica]|uniref:hypothetical protein n=1 Tax=Amycolatopsis rifamycinica TaxID=287986 RepID=UPI001F3CC367|nr:hypothetical protein [Amycolatopsis rifamycinica]
MGARAVPPGDVGAAARAAADLPEAADLNLSAPLGAATQARPYLRPGEPPRWAAYGRVLAFDVRGLTPEGQPDKSLLRKLGSGVAGFAGDVVLEAIAGGDDSGSGKPPPPQVIAFGDRAGVLAHEFLRGIPPRAAIQRLWVLTPARLLVLDAPVPPPEPAPEPEKSLLGKAVGFGRGVAKFGKDVAGILTDRTKTYGENREGEPIGLREFTPVAELPGPRIARVDRAKRGREPVLRVSLVDGSAFDFLEERTGADLAVRTATKVDEIIEREYRGHWLRPGEVLRLGCAPHHAHVGLRLGGVRHAPYVPAREVPKVTGGPPRWPLPTNAVPDEDWADDPALGYWATADDPAQVAVRLADHFAGGAGHARLTWTNQRLAVVYPTSHLDGGTGGPFTTAEEFDARVVARLDAVPGGPSFPPSPSIRFGFADGSAVFLRDALAATKVPRALSRA